MSPGFLLSPGFRHQPSARSENPSLFPIMDVLICLQRDGLPVRSAPRGRSPLRGFRPSHELPDNRQDQEHQV